MSNQGEDTQPADPFVDLLLWLVARNGGVHFANDGGVDVISATTVRRWLRGDYPKTRVEDSVGQVDLWARSKFPGEYPPESARGGLRFYCGPQRPTPGVAPHPIDASPQQTDDRTDPDTAEQPDEVSPPLPSPSTDEARPDANSPRRPHRRRWTRRRTLILAGVAVSVAAIAAGGITAALLHDHHSSPPSAASVLYARDDASVPVRACPDTTCEAVALPTGTHVQMICFRDAQRLDLNYSSTRWFNIRDPVDGVTGWVHSSEVSHQTGVGLC